ncbi:hypothetical protein VNO77_43558 [Canavalia gladiata]|uniref:Uncharacterized protein n=1 Tax=Canavalia gladiata TaxID=3824 RepID=A0AAN9JWG3_CANGL
MDLGSWCREMQNAGVECYMQSREAGLEVSRWGIVFALPSWNRYSTLFLRPHCLKFEKLWCFSDLKFIIFILGLDLVHTLEKALYRGLIGPIDQLDTLGGF